MISSEQAMMARLAAARTLAAAGNEHAQALVQVTVAAIQGAYDKPTVRPYMARQSAAVQRYRDRLAALTSAE